MNNHLESIFKNNHVGFYQLLTLCKNLEQERLWELLADRLYIDLKKRELTIEKIIKIFTESNRNTSICRVIADCLTTENLDRIMEPDSRGDIQISYELAIEIALRADNGKFLSKIAQKIKKNSNDEDDCSSSIEERSRDNFYSTEPTASEREADRLDSILFPRE